VHPIERLRAVARARNVDQRLLAREAAMVLGVLADDPFGLVTSCRRLLDRHPGAGALWWACARLLDAADPRVEARAIVRDLDDDEAVLRPLGLDLPEHSTVVVVPDAAGGSELVDRLAVRRDDLVPVEADDPAIDVAAVVEAGASLDAGPPLGAGAPLDPATLDPDPGTGPAIVLVEAGAAGPDRFLAVSGTSEGITAARARGLPVWLVVGVGSRLPAPLFDAAAARAPEAEVVPASATDRLVEARPIPCPCPPELLRPWPAA
jgi:hypothetical protein